MGKFKCSSCTFQTDFLLKIYEHKLGEHPDSTMKFNPQTTTVKEMALNLIAEQNMDLMEEFLEMKTHFKEAVTQLSGDIKDVFETLDKESKTKEENIKTVFNEFSKKLKNIEAVMTNGHRKNGQKPSQESQDNTTPPSTAPSTASATTSASAPPPPRA